MHYQLALRGHRHKARTVRDRSPGQGQPTTHTRAGPRPQELTRLGQGHPGVLLTAPFTPSSRPTLPLRFPKAESTHGTAGDGGWVVWSARSQAHGQPPGQAQRQKGGPLMEQPLLPAEDTGQQPTSLQMATHWAAARSERTAAAHVSACRQVPLGGHSPSSLAFSPPPAHRVEPWTPGPHAGCTISGSRHQGPRAVEGTDTALPHGHLPGSRTLLGETLLWVLVLHEPHHENCPLYV